MFSCDFVIEFLIRVKPLEKARYVDGDREWWMTIV